MRKQKDEEEWMGVGETESENEEMEGVDWLTKSRM